jgi:GT2 family glycosyltransferase
MNTLINELTIIIVLYEEKANLVFQCLENIKNFKIIIVDNAGNVSLKSEIEKKFKIYKYVINKKNIGFSKGINQAIKLSDTEFILNLQADCKILINDILKLYESIKHYKNCIITTPTFYDEKSNMTYSGGPIPEKKLQVQSLKLEGDTCVDIPSTAAVLFKKEDIINIGLFDEDFFIYFPDFELGRRIKSYKKSVIQIYEAKAIHEMGNLKINNPIKKIFIRNYYYTLDELIYYHKSNSPNTTYFKLKKKIPNYLIKFLINLILFKLSKSTYYFSKILAFFKFKKLLDKNRLI